MRLASYKGLAQLKEPEAFLMRAALNLSIDEHRARKSRGVQVLLEDVELVDSRPTAESALLARERIARLSECLVMLDPKTCRIFLAHRVEGLSYPEIARANCLSVSAIEKHVAKATMLITRSMEGW